MPTYDLRNTETGEVKEMILSISKKEEMVESGEWEQVHRGAMKIVRTTSSTLSKTGGDWKNLMTKMKKEAGGNSGLSPELKRKYGFKDNSIKD